MLYFFYYNIISIVSPPVIYLSFRSLVIDIILFIHVTVYHILLLEFSAAFVMVSSLLFCLLENMFIKLFDKVNGMF